MAVVEQVVMYWKQMKMLDEKSVLIPEAGVFLKHTTTRVSAWTTLKRLLILQNPRACPNAAGNLFTLIDAADG